MAGKYFPRAVFALAFFTLPACGASIALSPHAAHRAFPSPQAGSSQSGNDDEQAGAKSAREKGKDNDSPVRADQLHNPVLWRDPGRISSLDLFYGQGGEKGMPQPPFTFQSEDFNGSNPKFDVRDAADRKWRVKLGAEARPEVVASRLLWAVGYFANDDYVLPSAHVDNLRIKRGADLAKHGDITNARFARKPHGDKKIGIWNWKGNPFENTRELNGLRVMMAVMNNWDLKDVNNAVYQTRDGQDIFLASDVGASFGSNAIKLPISHSKGDLKSFEKSKFITRVTDTEVDFSTPAKPTKLLLETAGAGVKQYEKRSHLDWIGKKVPRNDARWIGSLLAQISHQQLVDAFRAGHFSTDEIEVYVGIVESRIDELKQL